MNKKALNLGRKYDEENKSRFAERPKGKFRELQLMPDEPKRVRFLHGPDQAIDLWIHYWKGKEGQRVRQLCKKAHYGEDCDVCATENKFGDPCWASYVRVFLGYCFDNVGTSYKIKKGKNRGKEVAIPAICAIDIPKGKNEQFWTTLDKAVTDGYYDDPDFCWELSKVADVGFTKPSLLPIKALGKQVSPVIPKDLLKTIAGYDEDDIAAQILNSCTGVRWDLFDLTQPEPEAKPEDAEDEDESEEEAEAPAKKATGTARKATSSASNDDEDDEPAPVKKKKPAPVVEDDEDEEEAPPPPRKVKPKPVAQDDDDDDEPAPVKKKKPAPVVEDDEEEEPAPVKKKKVAPVVEDDEDDEEIPPPPPKKKTKPVVVEDDDAEEEAAPVKKKKVAAKVEESDDDDEDYVPPPKKKRDKLVV